MQREAFIEADLGHLCPKEVLQPQTKNTNNCVTAGKVKKKEFNRKG